MTRTRVFYEFGEFVLDTGQRRLLRSDTGQAVSLSAKLFDTLLYLVEHAGQTIDKEVLLHAIWPGVIVEENSLTQNISALRQLLGEARGENRYIATIARKGYRFVANVERREEADVPGVIDERSPSRQSAGPQVTRRLIRPGMGLLLVMMGVGALLFTLSGPRNSLPATEQKLAVLPFKPLLPAERNESLELGMTESLISTLGQHRGQTISPLSSVRRYAALDQDAIKAGRELGVDTVVDGSLQRRGDRLRVSVRLLRVADGRQLWAQRFDQEFTTIFEVQEIIAARVAQALRDGWSDSERVHVVSQTQDPEAYALYANGRFAWTRQTEQGLLQAIAFFEQAIARDPNYALAYAGLADAHAVLGVFGLRAPHEVFPRARDAAEKAVSIDPQLAAAHSALGHIKVQYDHDWDGAARDYARAIQLDPSLALTYHRSGLLHAMQGDIDRALATSGRAQQLEPIWLSPKVAAGNFLYYAGRYEESIQLLEQVLVLEDRLDNARTSLVRSYIAHADYDRALAEVDKRPMHAPGSNALRAQALALSGRRSEALAELNRVLESSARKYVAAYDIALIYAALADNENAFLWLDRAVEDRSTLISFLAQEPMFDALHADPRFAPMVRRIGIYQRALPSA